MGGSSILLGIEIKESEAAHKRMSKSEERENMEGSRS
jgi:hypothetical protein